MIRLLIGLLIVALSLKYLSGLVTEERKTPEIAEDVESGEPYDPYLRAQKFGDEDYDKALEAKRESLDEQIDGG